MTVRIVGLSHAAQRLARLLLPPRSQLRSEFVILLRELGNDTLPGQGDRETSLPPGTKKLWFRRVFFQNLWVIFSFDDTHGRVWSISPNPPIPADDEPPSDPAPEAAE